MTIEVGDIVSVDHMYACDEYYIVKRLPEDGRTSYRLSTLSGNNILIWDKKQMTLVAKNLVHVAKVEKLADDYYNGCG